MKTGINFEPNVLYCIDSYAKLHCDGNRSKAVNDLLKKHLKIQKENPVCPEHSVPMIKGKHSYYCPVAFCVRAEKL